VAKMLKKQNEYLSEAEQKKQHEKMRPCFIYKKKLL